MKTIAGFGQFIRDTWAIFVGGFSLILWFVLTFSSPKTVTLDEKHWECTLPIAVGIMTDCREYTYKSK